MLTSYSSRFLFNLSCHQCHHAASLLLFGRLHTRSNFYSKENEEDDGVTITRLSKRFNYKPRSLPWYEQKLSHLLNTKNVSRAILLVENDMKQDKIPPSYFVLHKLIGICGQTGNVEKAFQYFHQMKRMGLRYKSKTFTILYNACTDSPDKTVGLEKANQLRRTMINDVEQGKLTDMNIATYKAMIRAFGRCGDIQTAFSIMDEAVERFKKVDADCFAALLHACIERRDDGFHYALKVLQQMSDIKLKPNVHILNLLLRAARDCSRSTFTVAEKLISSSPSSHLLPPGNEKAAELASLSSANDVSLRQPDKFDKLAVFGGVSGFLSHCFKLNEQPDIKTFTLLMQICQPSEENALFEAINSSSVTPDVNFFNLVLSKMNRQQRFSEAKLVLRKMDDVSIKPNLHTYGAMAVGCVDFSSAKELLKQLDNRRLMPSLEIFNILLFKSGLDFTYKRFLLTQMTGFRIQPNKTSIMLVEKSLARAKRMILAKVDHDKTLKRKQASLSRRFDIFSNFYTDWLRQTPIDTSNDVELSRKLLKNLSNFEETDDESSNLKSFEFVENDLK